MVGEVGVLAEHGPDFLVPDLLRGAFGAENRDHSLDDLFVGEVGGVSLDQVGDDQSLLVLGDVAPANPGVVGETADMTHAGNREELFGKPADRGERFAVEDSELAVRRFEGDDHIVFRDEAVFDLVVREDRLILLAEPDVHARVEEERLDFPGAVGVVGDVVHRRAECRDPGNAECEHQENDSGDRGREGPPPPINESCELVLKRRLLYVHG